MEDMTNPITKKLKYYKINEYFTIEGKGKRPFAQTYYFYADNEETARGDQ